MTLTATQITERQKNIGASDVAAILGLSPWVSAYDLWLEKTGKVEPREDTELTKAGRIFEDAVLTYAEEELGRLDRRGTERRIEGTPILVHCDALVFASREPVECKTTGLGGWVPEDWGESGTDEVPHRVLIQAITQARACERDVCHVPAFITGRGFSLFTIGHSRELSDIIIEKVLAFWNGYVLKDTPPEDSSPHTEYLKRRIRQLDKTVPLDPDVVAAAIAAQTTAREADKAKEAAMNNLIVALGDAEAGQYPALTLPDGTKAPAGVFTYKIETRKGYVVEPTEFRMPRFKKGQ